MSFSDFQQRAVYRTVHSARNIAYTGGHLLAAQVDLLRGEPERTFLRYGSLIRHKQLARESLWAYRMTDRLAQRHPDQLAAFRPGPVRPEKFLFFAGYSRSGHSLVAGLLDAHPNALISHELHALKHLLRGRPVDDVLTAIQYNSRFFNHFGRSYVGYSYNVAAQHQGSSSELKIIGDKKANRTAQLIHRHPNIVETLSGILPAPFVFLHVIRDPFDNIASRARRTRTSLEWSARGYFTSAAAIERLSRKWPDHVVNLYLDDLIADPKATLRGLLHRLGIDGVDEQYLNDCASIVLSEPNRTRSTVSWSPGLARSIEERLEQFGFLRRFVAGSAA